MQRISTIELFKESMKFSAAHFTIFSATTRENLHGHNYQVYASFTTIIEDEGLSFDYGFYKEKILRICQSINGTTLIPGKSKYLKISEQGDYYHIDFANETLIFLKRDVMILPITNATVEELSNWFLSQLLLDKTEITDNKIQEIKVKVFSGPGRSGSSTWSI